MRTPLPARVEAGIAAAICAMLASCGSPGDSGASAQFGTPVVTAIGTPSIPYSLAFGDFDRDRRLDILLRNGEGTLLLLRGNGDGTFGPVERIEGLVAAAGAAVGDLDRDGNLDLVVIGCPAAPCAREAVALFTMAGNGNGTFRAPVALPTPYPIAEGFVPLIADFNVDGWPDAGVVWWRPAPPIYTEWKELGIFLGTASGMTPAPHLTVSLGPLRPGHVVGVRTIDVDADGRPDLMGYMSAIEGGAGFAYAKLGLGDGTFRDASGSVHAPCVLAPRYALADFNRDGRLDFVIGMGDLCTAPMKIHLGNGDGTFGPAVPIDVHAPADVPASDAWRSQGGFHVGDLDGDGNPDIVMRWTDDSALSLLYGNGDGTFRAAVDYALDPPGWVAAFVDLNGDGRPDLVLAGGSGVVTMLNTR
jgi:hypothetical protein